MKPDRREVEALIEQAIAAWRPRGPSGEVRASPAWHDLGPSERIEVFNATRELRAMEVALDPSGLSSTAHAVLDRIRRR
jgi:hypothetical protein